MSRGCTPVACTISGVLLPTHTASSQCVLGSTLVLRLYLVSPPEPHSIGSPRASCFLKSSQRVALTAVASPRGAFACASIFFSKSGFFLRKSLISLVPLRVLHFSQAKQRF